MVHELIVAVDFDGTVVEHIDTLKSEEKSHTR